MVSEQTAGESLALPLGPWEDGVLPVRAADGTLSRQVWRVEAGAITTAQILGPLKAQIKAAGFSRLFDCTARACGGFDFRFAVDVTPPPEMFVDLDRYRFFSAAAENGAALTLLVSRTASASYVQLLQITPAEAAPLRAEAATAPAAPPGSLGAALEETGRVVLSDVEFATGADTLLRETTPLLEALAAYLKAHPQRRIALVGHTDTVGGLSGNIALSKRRAAAVRAVLTGSLGVPGAQVDAEGMGYLAPLRANLTDQGREANRRVEAVLLSLE